MPGNKNLKTNGAMSLAIQSVKPYLLQAGLFSAAVNFLMLVPIIYMLQVYDRVMSSGNQTTLLMLTVLMVALLASMGSFNWVRSGMLIVCSNKLEQTLRPIVLRARFKRALLSGGLITNAQPLADLLGLRQFLTGSGIFALFDAPWFPIYIAVMFMFHPWFGFSGIFAAIIMILLAFINQKFTAKALQEANVAGHGVTNNTNSALKNAEVIAALGMNENISARLESLADESLFNQQQASKTGGVLTSISKSFRIIIQSSLIGLGAMLALRQEISPGMVIAGSLLLGRALSPIDTLVGGWRGFIEARSQYSRLDTLLETFPERDQPLSLPPPEGAISVENLFLVPPGGKAPVLRGINLKIKPSGSIGIVGPSASGKSSLARAILGIWPPYTGKVRLDGADVTGWERRELGPHIGYLPQDIELFDGSIAENICRFGEVKSEKIIEAARLAGVHELILKLPQGYDTVIGALGGSLSGGERQRVGLARAMYDNPKILLLDEPNSNLDDQGEQELIQAIERAKALGSTVIVISHKPQVLKSLDDLLVLKDGTVAAFGEREEVLQQLVPRKVQLSNAV